MTETEKVDTLREVVKLAALTVFSCESFIDNTYTDTPCRRDVKAQINHFKNIVDEPTTCEAMLP